MQTKRIFNGYTVAKLAAGLALMAFSVHATAEDAVPAAEATDTAVATAAPETVAPASEPATAAPAAEPAAKPVVVETAAKPQAPETAQKTETLEPEPRAYPTQREPIRQLGRGVANIVTGVFEIPVNIVNVNKTDGGVASLSYGLFRGIWRFLVRETVGVFEIVTFPVGWAPVIEPEFLFADAPDTDWRVSHLHFFGEA